MVEGVQLIPLRRSEDERGWFMELMRASQLPLPVRQSNLVFSRKGVIRGLHYHERGQCDLFCCLQGMVRVVVLDRESGETVGFVGFVRRELDWGDEIELGWLIRRAHWGRGYATEAARSLRPLVPGRIVSMIRVENEASANVARKLGMSIERELDYYGFRTYVWVSEAAEQ